MFKPDAVGLADVHLSNSLPHAKPLINGSGLTDRFRQQLDAIGKAAAEAVRLEVPVIVLGDVYDRSALDAITLTESLRLMTKSGAEWIVIAGNHDAHSLAGGRFNVEMFAEIEHPRIRLLGLGDVVNVGSWDLHAMPFAAVEINRAQLPALRAAAAKRRQETGRKQCLILHQSIVGCKVEGNWIADHGLTPDETCQGFDQVLAGHLHEAQKFGPKGIGRYLGAPMQFRTSDAGSERGAVLLSFGDKFESRRLDIGAPRFFRVPSLEIARERGARPGDYVFVETTSISSEREAVALATDLTAPDMTVIHKHQPKYHHESRAMQDGLDGFRRSPLELALLYLSHETVNTGAFAYDDLSSEARQIFEESTRPDEIGAAQADIISMTLRNVLLFKSAKVSFDAQGLTFVQGKNQDSAGATSNGCGKTSIYKALGWVLYGQTIDDEDADGFIRFGADAAFGSVTISSFGQRWKIERERGRGRGKVRLIDQDGHDFVAKRKGVQEQINALIGFDFSVWRNIVLHDGDDPEAFSAPKCKDSERRALLHTILGTSYFAICHDMAKKRASSHAAMKREVESRIKVTQALIKDTDPAAASKRVSDWNHGRTGRLASATKAARERVAEWDSDRATRLAAATKAAADRISSWDRDRDLRLEAARQLAIVAREAVSKFRPAKPPVIDLRAMIRAEEDARARATQLEAQAPTRKVLDDLEKPLEAARKDRATHEATMERLANEIQRLEVDHCSACGQPINDSDTVRQLLAQHKAERQAAQEKLGAARARVTEISDEIKNGRMLRSESDAANRHMHLAITAHAQARRAQAEAETVDEKNASRLAELKSQVASAVAALDAVEAEKNPYVGQESEAAAGIAAEINPYLQLEADAVTRISSEINPYLELEAQTIAKFAELEARLTSERGELAAIVHAASVTDFWVTGFSPQGLPAMLLDVAMPVLTEQANAYLKILADGDISGCISTQGETKAGDAREKITMQWTVEGATGVTPSKGQRTKIRVAVNLALVDLAAARGLTSNLMLVDEVLDGLDAVGTERMLELLYKIRERKPSIFVISHHTGMAEDFERGLIVTKSEGASTVSVV